MMSYRIWGIGIVVFLGGSAGVGSGQVPIGTAFTYQGQLKVDGMPATGAYDLQFELYDANAAGMKVGATLTRNDLPISDGTFNTILDFGPVFGGQKRWLQILVRPGASNGAYTPLTSRQEITGTPFAIKPTSLDEAYDAGGPGLGRTINADNGAVEITGSFTASGDSGIGTTAPLLDFDVFRSFTILIGGGTRPRTTLGVRNQQTILGVGTVQRWLYLNSGSPNSIIRHSGSDLSFDTESVIDSGVTSEQMRLTNSGRLGIGTTTPKQTLHVNGDYYGRGHLYLHAFEGDGNNGTAYIQARDDSGSASINMRLRSQNAGSINDVMTLEAGGDVGIGITNPSSKLHVLSTSNSTPALTAVNFGSGGGAVITQIGGTAAALTVLYTGTGKALDVGGTARVEILEVTGADIAEKFPTTENAEPGTVMAIDPREAGRLRISREAYNRRVAGVVSGANNLPAGAVLGNLPGHDDAPAIALTGRVWVKGDAGPGPIEPGDLLTTSSLPGHAMRASDSSRAHGSILGKAMTELKDGTGLVLVLVSLQ